MDTTRPAKMESHSRRAERSRSGIHASEVGGDVWREERGSGGGCEGQEAAQEGRGKKDGAEKAKRKYEENINEEEI